MINNRQQSGRRRGRGGQRQGGGGGNLNGGNRIDNRARGNANQLYEKYKNLAADAQRQGDRVQTEYYLQFADHYYRVLAESRPRFEEQQRQQRAREDQFDDEAELEGEDYGDEGEATRPADYSTQSQPNGRDRGEGGERRRFEDRRPRRDDEERRPRREHAERFNGQPRAEQVATEDAQPQAAEPDLPLPEPISDAPQPRRRGRPRKEAAEEVAAFDADRLPPALGVAANDADPEAKPRRRRGRAAVEEAPAAE